MFSKDPCSVACCVVVDDDDDDFDVALLLLLLLLVHPACHDYKIISVSRKVQMNELKCKQY